MRQKNAHGQWRILTPSGTGDKHKVKLRGASICDENHQYLGYWHVQDMDKNIRRQLEDELRANWLPAGYDPEAL